MSTPVCITFRRSSSMDRSVPFVSFLVAGSLVLGPSTLAAAQSPQSISFTSVSVPLQIGSTRALSLQEVEQLMAEEGISISSSGAVT